MAQTMLTPDAVGQLAKTPKCPRCDFDKTFGNAICQSCRAQLPAHMRTELEHIPMRDPGVVARAIRAAANYFDVHFRSIREFGGGRRRR